VVCRYGDPEGENGALWEEGRDRNTGLESGTVRTILRVAGGDAERQGGPGAEEGRKLPQNSTLSCQISHTEVRLAANH